MKKQPVLILSLLLLIALNASVAAAAPALLQGESDEPAVLVVTYRNDKALAAAAARLDIWEVDAAARSFVAQVTPQERLWLAQNGYLFHIDQTRTQQLNAPPSWPCYRTVSEINAALQSYAAGYPELAELVEIGQSYEGRPLYVLRLAHKPVETARPRLFVLANIHGREMITPELALQFIDLLLLGYGSDPDLTWLLDEHEIYVMPSANPDGHVQNEVFAQNWRKNTHSYGYCEFNTIGVDLNRNHSYVWGAFNGSSPEHCDETYRGPAAASEPETQALQAYIRSLFPDQRPDDPTSPAPADTAGILISLHSYSNLVLWPWGWTPTAAPNADGLSAVGRKLAAFNGYTAAQSISLYPTSGTTDDWSYGELGIASYTFEIGSGSDGFFPACSRYDSLVQPNLKALVYAAKVARSPYLTGKGPEARSAAIWPQRLLRGQTAQLSVTLDDSGNGSQMIQNGEWSSLPFWDVHAAAQALSPTDGGWGGLSEEAGAMLDSSNLGPGLQTIYFRGQDSAGNWGSPTAAWVQVDEVQVDTGGPSGFFNPGDTLSYTLTLANHSPLTLTLALSQDLPAGTLFLAAPGGELSGNQITWQGLVMPPGHSLNLTIGLQITSTLGPLHSGELTLQSDHHLLPLKLSPALLGRVGHSLWLPLASISK